MAWQVITSSAKYTNAEDTVGKSGVSVQQCKSLSNETIIWPPTIPPPFPHLFHHYSQFLKALVTRKFLFHDGDFLLQVILANHHWTSEFSRCQFSSKGFSLLLAVVLSRIVYVSGVWRLKKVLLLILVLYGTIPSHPMLYHTIPSHTTISYHSMAWFYIPAGSSLDLRFIASW